MRQKIIMPLIALVAAVALFCGYQLVIRNAKDTQPPVITVEEGTLEVSVADPREALMEGISAVDAHDGDVTASVLIEGMYGMDEQNMTNVVYAAFDRAGNVSKVERKVCYRDYEAPKFYLKDSLSFREGQSFDVLEYVGAKDLIEGDISRRVRGAMVSDTVSLSQKGRHMLRFQVTNALGDTVEVELPVEVYDATWFTADVELKDYLVYLKRGAVFHPESYLDVFRVRGEEIVVRNGIPENVTCQISSDVDTRVPGVYEVIYTLSTNVNLSTHTGQTSLIVIVQE